MCILLGLVAIRWSAQTSLCPLALCRGSMSSTSALQHSIHRCLCVWGQPYANAIPEFFQKTSQHQQESLMCTSGKRSKIGKQPAVSSRGRGRAGRASTPQAACCRAMGHSRAASSSRSPPDLGQGNLSAEQLSSSCLSLLPLKKNTKIIIIKKESTV